MGFLSSINTGLAQTPDLTDIQSVGKLSYQFISIYNAIEVLQQAIDSYTGNTPASSSSDTATPESTVLVGNTANMYCTAGEALSQGYLVTLSDVSGVTTAKYARGASTGLAMGITMAAAASGASVQILLLGLFNFGSSVTPGTVYYMSPTVAGGISGTIPTTTGQVIQPVGFGVDTESIFFNPSLAYSTVPAPAS